MELSPEEKARLEQALEESKELKEEYNAIKEIRETLVQADALQFSPAFPDKVLARWAGRQQMAAYSNLFSEYLARLFLKISSPALSQGCLSWGGCNCVAFDH